MSHGLARAATKASIIVIRSRGRVRSLGRTGRRTRVAGLMGSNMGLARLRQWGSGIKEFKFGVESGRKEREFVGFQMMKKSIKTLYVSFFVPHFQAIEI